MGRSPLYHEGSFHIISALYHSNDRISTNNTDAHSVNLKIAFIGIIYVQAGKALDERKAEVRIQFKDAPGAT